MNLVDYVDLTGIEG